MVILYSMSLGQKQSQCSMQCPSGNIWATAGGSPAECSQLEHIFCSEAGSLSAFYQNSMLALHILCTDGQFKFLQTCKSPVVSPSCLQLCITICKRMCDLYELTQASLLGLKVALQCLSTLQLFVV